MRRNGSSNKLALTLPLLLSIAGCATVTAVGTAGMFDGRPFSVSYNGEQVAMRRALLQYLRPKALVSEVQNELIVDTEPYIGKSKGLFGLGPKWQEKIIYVVSVSGPHTHRRRSSTLPDTPSTIWEPSLVQIEARVLERQNSNFDWQRKVSEPVRPAAIREFYLEIQNFVSKFSS